MTVFLLVESWRLKLWQAARGLMKIALKECSLFLFGDHVVNSIPVIMIAFHEMEV